MALVLKDRVKETTTTTGTGTYTLAGAVAGFEAFSEIGNSNTTYYCCTDGTDFEVGIGTYTLSGTTLARTTILQSSNSDNAVNWSSGSRTIFCTQPAEKAVFLDDSGDIQPPDGGSIKLASTGGTPVINIAGGGPNTIRFHDASGFNSTTNAVDISYRTTPNDLIIERASGENIAEFGGDDGHAALYFNDSKKLETLTGGVDITGNITVSGTVDGRDLATDGTKLDGIEASADVTDTTNVTAAGALMDSEVTNLAQVKAFDSSDYATAAQGTTADAALPKAGGTMTGNLELNNVNIVFEGSTADANETTLTAIDPTADRTISLPNQSGTVMVTLGDSYRSGVSQTYSGAGSPAYLVDGEYQEIATVTPSGNSHNYFFSGRIVAQSGQNVHTLNITVALRSNTLPDLSFTANYDEDVVGTASQYITPVLFTKETSPASFILAVEVHNTIFGTLTADLDFFARTQADLADISVNTTDGSEITSTPSGYTLNQFTKTTALDNSNQFVFNQDVQFTGAAYNAVWDKSQNRLEFADNAAASFGSSADGSIQHTGSNLQIFETTGGLQLINYANDSDVEILTDDGSGGTATYFKADGSTGAAELYHYGTKKLETSSAGVTVTGDATVSGDLFVNGGTIRSEDGTLDFGDNSADNWGQISYQSATSINGFTSQFGNAVRFSNEQGSTEQHMLLLDTAANNSANIWGVSQGNTPILGVTGQSHIKMYHPNGSSNSVTISPTTPTASRTITLPDATGTVLLTDGDGSSLTALNATQLTSGTVPNARLDQQLQDVAGLAVTNGNFIVGDGSNFVAESGATARTSLGLGSIATQASDNVSITGGSVSGITDLAIADGGTGASSASAARTNLGLGTIATQAADSVNIDGGAIDGVTIGTNTVASQLRVDNLRLDGNHILSLNTNGGINLEPNGTGNVNAIADTLRIGDQDADATITTHGTGDLTLNTNSGTNSGSIVIADAANGNISLTPNGTGSVIIDGLNYPQADGSNGQVLTTNGSGTLSFSTITSGVSNDDATALAIALG